MPIEIDIAHLSRLARLNLSDDEMDRYRSQLGVILDHAAKVQSLEGEPEVEVSHPLGFVNAFRPDVVTASLDRDEILEQAPASSEGYFVAPPALDI